MYRVQKVSPNNINALFEIAADNAFRVKEIEEQVFRNEGMYYILEDGEKILASAYWIQDPEREHWIRLKSVKVDIQKGGNLAEILEALIEASEHSFCITYQNSFRREGIQAQVQGAIFEKKETFSPMNKNEVGMYGCGPTVYHYAHLGNMRTYTFVDLLKRTILFNGYKVKHVINITDVGHLVSDADEGEDKMLKGAKREKKTVWQIAEFYTQAVKKDMEQLNIISPTIWCKATDHIKEQLEMIGVLEKKGYTYTAGGNVYFDTSKLKEYGKLARLNLKAEQKARVEKDKNKKNQNDFVLWFTKSKFDDPEMKWDSKYGQGFPGWHLECSAMATKYLGEQFDIHCGAIDLIPTHHTNEIAQSEAALGVHPWVHYWMHGEFLVLSEGNKMSKSSGDFLTLQVVIDKGYDPMVYRYFCLGTHYRKPLMFSWEAMVFC